MGQRFPTIVAAWRRAWSRVIPFFAFLPDIRRVLYTTAAPPGRRQIVPRDSLALSTKKSGALTLAVLPSRNGDHHTKKKDEEWDHRRLNTEW